jgi:RND family efflux transporter MFP subunit
MQDGEPNKSATLIVNRHSFSNIQKVILLVAIVAVFLVIALGIHSRGNSVIALASSTERAAVPVVNVVSVSPSKDQAELVLPGSTQPFNDAPIYARTNGYLKHWYVDIGAHVRQGQLLADIETPELDQQLEQARADLRTAHENEDLAQTTATRWVSLLKDDAVSKQETDQYVSDLSAKKSALDAAKANVQRLEQLQSFERIYAPFSGVITARNTDIGTLIDAGAAGTPKELFHVAAVSRLRIYVSVPEADSAAARDGTPVSLTLEEYPGKTFTGIVTRNTDSIDQTTRTLKVEIDVENKQDQIKTGAYVLAHFRGAKQSSATGQTLILPANTLLFRSEGLRVAVVRNGRAELTPISVGRDFGSSLEVTSGISQGDLVIVNPSDSLTSGTAVKISSPNGATPR